MDASPVHTGALEILLVEDDATVADVVAGLLRARGHRVTHAPHGLAALTEVAAATFDVAFLDLDLPGLDGMALALQLRRRGIATPLILGSFWALVPAGIAALLLIGRTALEDRLLLRELPGYMAYAQAVRYRLLPGVW